MSMARGAELSLFDEPEAGIDLWSFQNLIGVFRHLHEVTGGSILIISHQERILNMVDTIMVLEGGRIEKIGPRDEILPGLILPADDCRATCDYYAVS